MPPFPPEMKVVGAVVEGCGFLARRGMC